MRIYSDYYSREYEKKCNQSYRPASGQLEFDDMKHLNSFDDIRDRKIHKIQFLRNPAVERVGS